MKQVNCKLDNYQPRVRSKSAENKLNVLIRGFLLIVFLMFIVPISRAQSVNYKISESSTEYHRVQAWFCPFYVDAYLANINMGWGAGAKVSLYKNLQFTTNFQKSTEELDMGYRSAVVFIPVHNVADQDFKVTKSLDLGVNLVFSDKEKIRPVRVNLRSSRSGNYTTTTFIEPTLTVRKLYSLRGGINLYNSTMSTDELESEMLQTDKYTFSLYGAYDIDGNEVFSTNGLGWAVPVNMATLSVGIGSDLIINSAVEVSGYGTKHAKRTTSHYVDFLFAPIVNVHDLVLLGEDIDVSGDGENQFGISRLGFRYGIDYLFTRRAVSFGASMEIGIRPGLAGKGFFLNGRVYLPFINLIKR